MVAPLDEGGRIVADRYQLVEELGRGGMGIVWRGRDTLLDREVAVKQVQLPRDMGDDERAEAHERVRRESRSAARLADHPNVITLHDVFDFEGNPWVVMQLVSGRSLEEVLRDSGPLPPERLAGIATEILDALHEAHSKGVLHRDVKPGNVMLADDGHALLTDFGIATLEGDTSITRTGVLAGSPEYMAPERFEGKEVGAASDLWSLGVTLYAALTGSTPFRRETLPATIGAVVSSPIQPPPAGYLTAPIMGLLERDPAQRLSASAAKGMITNPPQHMSGPQATHTPPHPTGPGLAFGGGIPGQVPPGPPGRPAPPGPAGPAGPPMGPAGWTTPSPVAQATPPPYAQYSDPRVPSTTAPRTPSSRKRLFLGIGGGTLALVLLASVAIYFLTTRPATTEYRNWADDTLGVEYPEDWLATQDSEDYTAIFHPRENDRVLDFTISWYEPTHDDTVEEVVLQEEHVAEDFGGYERLELTPTEDHGFPDDWDTVYWESTHNVTREQRHEENLDHDERFRVALQSQAPDGTAYWIQWTGPLDEREHYRDIIDYTLASFHAR